MTESYAEPEQRKRGGQVRIPFTQDIADIVCERLINGESLRSICCDADMPSAPTVCDWLNKHPDFAEQYARAREAQADTLADEILDISDNGVNDWVEKHGADGQAEGWEYNGDAIQRSKLRVDARKWYAAKLAPKKYGERLDLNATSTATVVHLIDSSDISALDNDQREALKEIANALLAQRSAGRAISQWEGVDHEAIEGELSNKDG